MRLSCLILLSALAACGGREPDSDGDGDADADGDTDADSDADSDADADADADADGDADGDVPCSGFDVVPWAYSLPAGRPQDALATYYETDYVDGSVFLMRDLDGDGFLDIAFTRAAEENVGFHRWLFFAGSATGFSADYTDWDLPDELNTRLQFGVDYQSGDGETFLLMELDGDGMPDVVYMDWPADAAVGDTIWRVYSGYAAGFAEVPTTWTLPTGYGDEAFIAPQTIGPLVGDWTGDGAPDLVMPVREDDPDSGVTHWKVHAGNGSGFDDAAIDWTLPDLPGTSFAEIYDEEYGDEVEWALRDVDGDGLRDLTVTTAAVDHWDVYPATGSGFGDAYAYAVPERASSIAAFNFFEDVDGDGWLDLTVLADPTDAQVGHDHWLLYRGSPTGLGAEETLAFPSGFPDGTWTMPDSETVLWNIFDVTGDGIAEVFVTHDERNPALGNAEWAIYQWCP